MNIFSNKAWINIENTLKFKLLQYDNFLLLT